MGYNHDERQKLLAAGKELSGLLREVTPAIWKVLNMLDSAADELKVAAADEVTAGDMPKVKKVTFTSVGRVSSQEPLSTPITPKASAPIITKKRRKCSLCHEPGHWATNCPNAHIERKKLEGIVSNAEARRAAKAAKPKRILSPERRAQLAKNLVKARAAKKRAS